MNEKADALKQRTKKFALDVLAFGRTFLVDDQARDIGRQLTRAATSVGANYRAIFAASSITASDSAKRPPSARHHQR